MTRIRSKHDVPFIRLSDNELSSGTLDPATRLLAKQVFTNKGVVAIENALRGVHCSQTSKAVYSLRFADRMNQFEVLRHEFHLPWYISSRRGAFES
jgi:hypothetical protein